MITGLAFDWLLSMVSRLRSVLVALACCCLQAAGGAWRPIDALTFYGHQADQRRTVLQCIASCGWGQSPGIAVVAHGRHAPIAEGLISLGTRSSSMRSMTRFFNFPDLLRDEFQLLIRFPPCLYVATPVVSMQFSSAVRHQTSHDCYVTVSESRSLRPPAHSLRVSMKQLSILGRIRSRRGHSFRPSSRFDGEKPTKRARVGFSRRLPLGRVVRSRAYFRRIRNFSRNSAQAIGRPGAERQVLLTIVRAARAGPYPGRLRLPSRQTVQRDIH